MTNQEQAVIKAAIRCYYTDGTDGPETGSYMRGVYADLKAAVDDLIRVRRMDCMAMNPEAGMPFDTHCYLYKGHVGPHFFTRTR